MKSMLFTREKIAFIFMTSQDKFNSLRQQINLTPCELISSQIQKNDTKLRKVKKIYFKKNIFAFSVMTRRSLKISYQVFFVVV